MKGSLVAEQPAPRPNDFMDLKHSLLQESELQSQFSNQGERCDSHGHGHKRCHKSKRRFLFLIFGLILTLGTVIVLLCSLHEMNWDGSSSGFWSEGFSQFVKRAPGDPSQDNGSVFIDRKYYLIIIFVGLLLVVIAAIMLSAWCCRGAFRNPLCCPCYLCACCGGLVCLECIGCGLCAEGISEM